MKQENKTINVFSKLLQSKFLSEKEENSKEKKKFAAFQKLLRSE